MLTMLILFEFLIINIFYDVDIGQPWQGFVSAYNYYK